VVYQVYPRSFQDSNGDGIGDLPGIITRLDHLAWLGVDAVWLSPVFRSPMRDFGYDVADYTDVDPLFGSLADLDGLIAAAHRRGIRVLLDFVPNHTSSDHPWFLESRSSRASPKRDWYLWADPRVDGSPPTNWRSTFGGSGWTLDEATGQYWYHAFLPEQPDLNWRNSAVRAAMADVLRFWLDRGIDGFRIDVIWHLVKDDQLRDNPAILDKDGRPTGELDPVFSADRPEVFEIIREWRDVIEPYGERLLIGELYLPVERLAAYYGHDGRGVHLPFNFQLVLLPWDASAISVAIAAYEAVLPAGGWPNWVLGNHDQSRVATRVGAAQARVAAMLLLTLRGTPTIYYGDELGMTDVSIPPERVVDVDGRDPQRTPMPWDGTRHGGFTDGEPWLPLAPEAELLNVARLAQDPRSILHLHRRLLALRAAESALSLGDWLELAAPHGVVAYERAVPGRRLLVVLNLTSSAVPVPVSRAGGRILLATGLDREGETVGPVLALGPHEGVVLEPLA
jgi:alpha-glucosidase